MKIKPKKDPYEDYFNEGDLDGFHIERIFPKRFEERRDMEVAVNKETLFYDDLLDLDVEVETRRNNKVRKFTEKLPPNEYSKLTDEEKESYHAFLCDYLEEQNEQNK